MRKIFIILSFLIFATAIAQDSIASQSQEKVSVSRFRESDVLVDNDSIYERKFDSNFKRNYKDSEFIYEEKSQEKNAWDRFLEWLADIFRNIFNFTSDQTSMSFVVGLLKFIAIAIVSFVIYLIAKSIVNKEGKWIFGKNSDKKIINYSDVEKNLQLVDFEKLIATTLQNGEKRLSIRYYYLWLLKKMSANEIIVWDLEKTNSDYLYEIKNPAQKQEFEYLSYLYNYIWYGEFELDDETFYKAKTAFENAIKSLRNV